MAKKKILLLSDDLRMGSGIATVSKQLVLGTVKDFDWVQLGAAIKHPEAGKLIDISDEIKKHSGVEDANVRIYPNDGYGNPETLRNLILHEKPDLILHFTDPRYWVWLYEMAHEIREHIPLTFLTIWDDLPTPMYNANFYASCDTLFCISRQTYGIVNRALRDAFGDELNIITTKSTPLETEKRDTRVYYCPHGMNFKWYHKVTDAAELKKLANFKKHMLSSLKDSPEPDFVMLWINRNIRRKQPGDVILAYKMFCDTLTKEQSDKCLLIMHTQPVDDNGTDLPAVKAAVCPDYNVLFSAGRHDEQHMNFLHNIADMTINIANNEGFGLTTCESLAAGTPISVNVTGGLQDQCGFTRDDGKELVAEEYIDIESLHDWRVWENKLNNGIWAYPIWPRTRSLNGSPPTPYIFDDRVDLEDVKDAIAYWYNMPKEEREAAGAAGAEWLKTGTLNQDHMCQVLIDGVNETLENFVPLPRFELYEV